MSKKQDSTSIDIQTFKRLLIKTDTSIDKLRELIVSSQSQTDTLVKVNKALAAQTKILANQLHISQNQQSIANRNAAYTAKANEIRLFATVQKIHAACRDISLRIIHIIIADSSADRAFVEFVSEGLSSQLENPFLVSNPEVYRDWWQCLVFLRRYENYMAIAQMPYTNPDSIKSHPSENLQARYNRIRSICYDEVYVINENLYQILNQRISKNRRDAIGINDIDKEYSEWKLKHSGNYHFPHIK